jgi:thiosulfate dehydrogenase [quinone] large subunit
MFLPTSKPSDLNSSARILGYTTLRLAIGMTMLIHGLGRLPHISVFTQAMLKLFAGSALPPIAVAAFARITPPIELAIGLLVLFGFATRFGLTMGGLWMMLLIFGSTLIEKYDVVGIQLIYSLIFHQLLQHLEQNRLSMDALLHRADGKAAGANDNVAL